MNNDTLEVNTHEASGTQGKVALKYCQKKIIIFNAYLALFIRFKFTARPPRPETGTGSGCATYMYDTDAVIIFITESCCDKPCKPFLGQGFQFQVSVE